MTNQERIQEMTKRLNTALNPIQLEITDDSAQHIGHPGAVSGAGHFTVSIVSDQFEGKSLVARHKLVYQAIGNLMEREIHALRIDAIPSGKN